jgi:hypothetical protein
MSDQSNEQAEPVKVPLSTETLDAALKVVEEKSKTNEMLDPYILFTQIEAMRKDGVDEETIRTAFNEFMAQRNGTYRKAIPKMKRSSQGLPPIPTQEEINKFYTDKLAETHVAPSLEMQAIVNAAETVNKLSAKRPGPKVYLYRAAYYTVGKFLGLLIYFLNKAGIK